MEGVKDFFIDLFYFTLGILILLVTFGLTIILIVISLIFYILEQLVYAIDVRGGNFIYNHIHNNVFEIIRNFFDNIIDWIVEKTYNLINKIKDYKWS